MKLHYYETAIGKIGIITDAAGKSITHLLLPNDPAPKGVVLEETPLHQEAARQLNAYLQNQCKTFTLPFAPAGSAFFQSVWNALCAVPFGETATYKEIAQKVGSPKGFRAVGLANNRNPIPIFIPCHRIVGSNGALTGYRGGLPMKEKLLAIEGR